MAVGAYGCTHMFDFGAGPPLLVDRWVGCPPIGRGGRLQAPPPGPPLASHALLACLLPPPWSFWLPLPIPSPSWQRGQGEHLLPMNTPWCLAARLWQALQISMHAQMRRMSPARDRMRNAIVAFAACRGPTRRGARDGGWGAAGSRSQLPSLPAPTRSAVCGGGQGCIRRGWGVWLPPPPPPRVNMVPAEAGPKVFRLESSWHRKR